MSYEEEGLKAMTEHMLTEKEKELREWLRTQPGGAEMWVVVKAGFVRSYNAGLEDARGAAPERK